MSFKRDKVSGLVDYGQVTHNGRHSRQCVKFHNPSLDPDEYPWEGKVCRWEPWDNDEENADPNITPNVTPFASTFESHQAVNVEEDMKQMVDDMAQADLNIAASHIWDKVSLHFDEKYDRKWTGLNKGPCIDRVRKARKELNHGDAFRTVENTAIGMMTDTPCPFLQFHGTYPNKDKPGEMKRIMVFGNPVLFEDIRAGHEVDGYTDATFGCAPDPFYQVLIFMIFHRGTNIYLPIAYILMTHKDQELYWEAFSRIVVLSNWKIKLHSYTTDFERGLMNACAHHFPEGFHVGCFFHLKQAWRKYLIETIGFLAAAIRLAMSVGGLDLLCIIPQDEVVEFGIPYVRSVIENGLPKKEVKRWDLFWEYFERQWIPILNSWNLCDANARYKDILNKTNNGLESYNKRINRLFPSRPSLIKFVQTMEAESRYQARRMDLLRRCHEKEPVYQGVTIPEIPKAYKLFKKSFVKAARKAR